MLVRRDEFQAVVKKLSAAGIYGLDTETTGLRRGDRLFSIIIADELQGYYFSFNEDCDHLGNYVPDEYRLPREWISQLAPITENEESIFFLHNAKFDLGMLSKDDCFVTGQAHCTEAMERVLQNNYLGHKPYSLKSCAKRRGLEKDAAVEDYIKQHGLITKLVVPGKDKIVELWHFDKVPFQIISPYGCTDAVITRAIGIDQLKKFAAMDSDVSLSAPQIQPLILNERKVTRTCFRMEEAGLHIDREYTRKAMDFTLQQAKLAEESFQTITGRPFEDSATVIKEVFDSVGLVLPKTATGKAATNKKVLDDLEHPIADKIREIRGLKKLVSTYYSSFLYFADDRDLVHANIRQGGTETSRFSYSDPNLQNLPKEDEPEDRFKDFHVRKCFTPINRDFVFVPIDYRQQEFRMMLDYAGEHELIAAIMAGEDVHEATARMLGITRKQAKTINFGLLYGMGVAKLAAALKVSLDEARRLKALYFRRLPKVQTFIEGVIAVGRDRRFIWNWHGFRNHISSPEYAYVLPNHLIQGGCAQVLRVAMPQLDQYIIERQLRTQMVAQVHDEILFQVHKDELHHVAHFQKIMESVYKPKNGMYLHCSVEHSWDSWGKWDQTKGLPALKVS